jgi:hypothetical protein
VKTEEREPFRGIRTWKDTEDNILRVRLHYSADDDKNPLTEKGKAWVEAGKKNAPSLEWWNQEQEIMFDARQGARIYHQFQDDATQVVEPFQIPESWTRYFGLDPHPRVPHAMLWAAMSPEGILYPYRELWPSRVYGTSKNVPEDDNVFPIRHYVETIKFLESEENPENGGKKEKIHLRVIDYAARAFGVDRDNPDAINYQERYEQYSREIGHPLYFEDCTKDNDAAYEEVNEWLRPVPSLDGKGEVAHKARLRIFRNLRELRWELLNNRVKMLQAHQVDTKDPEFKIIDKRNHLTDVLKYLIVAKPRYVQKKKVRHTAAPLAVR